MEILKFLHTNGWSRRIWGMMLSKISQWHWWASWLAATCCMGRLWLSRLRGLPQHVVWESCGLVGSLAGHGKECMLCGEQQETKRDHVWLAWTLVRETITPKGSQLLLLITRCQGQMCEDVWNRHFREKRWWDWKCAPEHSQAAHTFAE